MYSGAPLKRSPTPLEPLLCVRGIHKKGAFGILPVDNVVCTWDGEHNEVTFSDLCIAVRC